MPHPPDAQDEAMRPVEHGFAQRLALAGTFVCAALRYWLLVFPRTCIELRRWRRRAAQISDPLLRRAALVALGKRANIEGAAAFAAVMPARRISVRPISSVKKCGAMRTRPRMR